MNAKTKPRPTKKDRAKLKAQAFDLLFDGVSTVEVANRLGVNRGTVSRWRRHESFALYSSQRERNENPPPVEYAARPQVSPVNEDPVKRGKFIEALRLTGRIDIATSWADASPEQVLTWFADETGDAPKAHAETMIRVMQSLTNVMRGIGDDGIPDTTIKAGDKVRAAQAVANLVDWRKEVPHLQIQIGDKQSAQAAGPSPLQIMIESMRDELLEMQTVELEMAPDDPTAI